MSFLPGEESSRKCLLFKPFLGNSNVQYEPKVRITRSCCCRRMLTHEPDKFCNQLCDFLGHLRLTALVTRAFLLLPIQWRTHTHLLPLGPPQTLLTSAWKSPPDLATHRACPLTLRRSSWNATFSERLPVIIPSPYLPGFKLSRQLLQADSILCLLSPHLLGTRSKDSLCLGSISRIHRT